MLRIDNLSKRYGDYLVFQGLTHTFTPGCVALCEEDSTGKSSLLNIIAGVIAPDSGMCGSTVTRCSMRRRRPRGVWHVPDNCLLFPEMTGRGLLERVAAEKNVALDEATLELAYDLGLEPHLDKRFEQMSTGTRRKVFCDGSGVGDPAVVIADGPSNGFDARGRAVLAELFMAWGRIASCCLPAMIPNWCRLARREPSMWRRCVSRNDLFSGHALP